MSKQTINLGIRANDGKGDSLRVAFGKTNNNFTELFNTVSHNSNVSNTYYETNQELAQNAYNKANTASLGNILFYDTQMYSNSSVQIGNNDYHGRKAWGMTFGQTVTQANNAFGNSVAYDSQNNILVAFTTQNEVTGLPQSTLIKFDSQGLIYWRNSVPAYNVNNILLNSYAKTVVVDANDNVYLLTDVPDDASTLVTKFNYLGQNVWNTLISDSIDAQDLIVDDEEFPYYVGHHNLITGLDITGELYFTHFNLDTQNTHSVMALPNRGGVYVGDDRGYVHKFSTEGVYIWSNFVSDAANKDIVSLSYDNANNWYASTTEHIYKFDDTNSLVWEKEVTGSGLGGPGGPMLSGIKYSNDYIYAFGAAPDPSGKDAFIVYKIHSANGELVWANSLQVTGAATGFMTGNKKIDVKNDFILLTGYATPNNSTVSIATVFQLPIDGSLAGTYFGSESTKWGDFYYVSVPEATTVTSSTVGSGETSVTVADNVNYAYTMDPVVYQNPSPENEEHVKVFIQKWNFTEDGTVVIPSSGSDLAIEFSGKYVTNVGRIEFADSSTQYGAAISITDLQSLVASSTDFADFKNRIASL